MQITWVCLYADRPQFIPRLLRSFRSQIVPDDCRLSLVVYDNGVVPWDAELQNNETYIRLISRKAPVRPTIGMLRNEANDFCKGTDIILHADSDDWSSPTRTREQVEALRDHPGNVVGYTSMPFWDSRSGEAWLYSNKSKEHLVGTSLCYWRRAWEAVKFQESSVHWHNNPLGIGEDREWIRHHQIVGVEMRVEQPQMIAEIHGGNISSTIVPSPNWLRAPEMDDYCRKAMEL